MTTLSIFVSFQFDKDNKLRGSFYGQAKTRTNHRILDGSLREAYPTNEWKTKAQRALKRCDVVILVVGEDTHNSLGVAYEIKVASRLKKPILQIRPQGSTYTGLKGLGEPKTWHWKAINNWLDEIAPPL